MIWVGYTDIDDPLAGDVVEGIIVIQEIDPVTKIPQVEFTCTSGRYKSLESDGDSYKIAFYAFRSFKWPLLP